MLFSVYHRTHGKCKKHVQKLEKNEMIIKKNYNQLKKISFLKKKYLTMITTIVTPTAKTDFLLPSIKSSNLSKHPVKLYFVDVGSFRQSLILFSPTFSFRQQVSGTL